MNTQHKIAHPPYRRATYQDVLDAPPNKLAEVIDGTLHVAAETRRTAREGQFRHGCKAQSSIRLWGWRPRWLVDYI